MSRHSAKPDPTRELRRQRAMAQLLHHRVLLNGDGKLLLIGGRPDFESLWEGLLKLEHPSDVPCLPKLDGEAHRDGELTPELLQNCGHALRRWKLSLEHAVQRRRPRKGAQHRYAQGMHEIERLERRLAGLYQWRRELEAGHAPAGVPYLLHADQQQQLQTAFHTVAAVEDQPQLPPLLRTIARIVLWWSGPVALRRYLQAVSPVLETERAMRFVNPLRELCKQLRTWRKRAEREDTKWLFRELRSRLAQLPHELRSAAGIQRRPRGANFDEVCKQYLDQCESFLRDHLFFRRWNVCAGLAALAACDRGAAALPLRIVREAQQRMCSQSFTGMLRALHEQSREQGYDALLVAIDRLHKSPYPRNLGYIRQRLRAGERIEDIDWALQDAKFSLYEHPLSLRVLRRLQQQLQSYGLSHSLIASLLSSLGAIDVARLVTALPKWLAQIEFKELPPDARRQVSRALTRMICRSFEYEWTREALRNWLAAPNAAGSSPFREQAPPAVRPRLDRIARYQRAGGGELTLPKSLHKWLDTERRRDGERRFLSELVAAGRASELQHHRWRHLQAIREQDRRPGDAQLARTSLEAEAATSLEALRGLLRQGGERIWLSKAHTSLPEFSLPRLMGLVCWLEQMDDAAQGLLRQVLTARRQYADAYKSHLPENAAWLAKAAAAGVDLEAWLRPGRFKAWLDGREVVIGVAHEPFDVFMMGTWFHTCLSQGGCNQMAVLANAYDANKQVVFMRDAKTGAALARQLLAFNQDFQLLGYHCYSVAPGDDEATRDKYIAAMAQYAGTLAADCGVPLTDEGEPDEIGEHFWYDDGAFEWHAAARAAWQTRITHIRSPEHANDVTSEDCTAPLLTTIAMVGAAYDMNGDC